MTPDGSRRIRRREFVKAAVAIGGSSALSACMDRELPLLSGDGGRQEFPDGTDDPASLPARQHAWNDFLVHDAHGNTVLPQHQVILGLRYVGETPPTDAERTDVETALQSVERAVAWGTTGDPSAAINDGLLFMLGYAPRFFDGIGGTVPWLDDPVSVLEEVGEAPSKTDGFDAVLVLNSDFGSLLLGAELALFGDRDSLNGRPMEGTLDDIFERVERRSGVVGKGLPADNLDVDRVPETAPLSMGFKSGFTDNQATEDRITIEDGRFAGGTTLQTSRLRTDLERWYDEDYEGRLAKMFCPAHDPDDVGKTGAKLGSHSRTTRDHVDDIDRHARVRGRVGHGQKTAKARDEEFEPRILRRSEGVATDVSHTAFNFASVQASIADFVATRKAMNPGEYDHDIPDDDHGIADYLHTVSRGTYLVPPRSRRALPAGE